jgi:hypothetical protein
VRVRGEKKENRQRKLKINLCVFNEAPRHEEPVSMSWRPCRKSNTCPTDLSLVTILTYPWKWKEVQRQEGRKEGR